MVITFIKFKFQNLNVERNIYSLLILIFWFYTFSDFSKQKPFLSLDDPITQ